VSVPELLALTTFVCEISGNMVYRYKHAGTLMAKAAAALVLAISISFPVSSDEPTGNGSQIGQRSAQRISPAQSIGHRSESGNRDAMGVLVDLTLCVGCRACVVACKEWNGLPLNQEDYFRSLSAQKENAVFVGDKTITPRLSADTYTVVEYHDVRGSESESPWVFVKRQCMHCLEPACESACPVGAFRKTAEGPVVYDSWKCMGCRYCMMACPFGVPTYEWQNAIPFVRKCTFCFDRITDDGSLPLTERVPACVKACPANALMFGRRVDLLAEARRRIAANPGKYIDHIYGEHEAGGTSWLYISSVPFDKLGFPMNVGVRPYPEYTDAALGSVPLIIVFGGTILAGLCLLFRGKRGQRIDACGPSGGGNSHNRPKIPGGKTFLFALVMLSAIASGAYSLSQKHAAEGGAAMRIEAIPAAEAPSAQPGIRSIESESGNESQPSESHALLELDSGNTRSAYPNGSSGMTHESLPQQIEALTPAENLDPQKALSPSDHSANTSPLESEREEET